MGHYEIDFQVVSQVRDEAANASNVTIALRFRRTDFYYVGWNDLDQERWRLKAKNFSNQDTGDIGWNLNYKYSNPLPQNQWREVGRNNFRLPHNEDGSLTINIYGKIYFGVEPGILEAQKTITCTPNNRNVRITQFEKNSTSGTTIRFTWATSGNIDALHLYNGDTKLKEYSVSGSGGSIDYTVIPNTSYRFQIRVKKAGTNLWTNSGYIDHVLGYPTITNSLNFNIDSPISLYFDGIEPPSSVYFYVDSKDDSKYFAEKTLIRQTVATINLTQDQKNKVYRLAGTRNRIPIVVVQNLHINGVETPYRQYNGTMSLQVSGTAPTFTNFSYSNTNSTISNILGTTSKTIANMEGMQAQISMGNKAHSSVSTISSYVCTITGGRNNNFYRTLVANENQYSEVLINLGAMPEGGTYTISIHAVDARGIASSDVTRTFEVIDYHVPMLKTCELKRLNNFDREVTLYIEALYSKLLVNGQQQNSSFNIQYRYRESGSSSWGSYTSLSNYSSSESGTDKKIVINKTSPPYFLTNLDQGLSYDFEFKLTDRITSKPHTVVLPQGIAPMSIFEDGTVAINREPDFAQSTKAKLQVAGDIMVKKGSSSQDIFVYDEVSSLKSQTTDLTNDIAKLTNNTATKLNGKVNLSDIVDNLTSNETRKPLSANQGRILKEKLDSNMNAEKQDLHGRPWGHDMFVKLSKIGTHVVCDIKWTGSVGSQSGTISEITVPSNFRPYDNVFTTTLNVSGGSHMGCTRICLSPNGKFSFVTENTGFLERYATFSYRIS